MRDIKIEYVFTCCFIGCRYILRVSEHGINNSYVCDALGKKDEIDAAIVILKNEYGIAKTRDEVEFIWDNTM